MVFNAWKKMSLEMLTPKATFYRWGEIPRGYTSQEFCLKLLAEQSVWMIPGSIYGKSGEGFIRISCAQSKERIAQAMALVLRG